MVPVFLGVPNVPGEINLIQSFPNLTMKAKASSPMGSWVKQKKVIPFRTILNTYYATTASPSHIKKNRDQYPKSFSATTQKDGNPFVKLTLGFIETKDLDGSWMFDSQPIVPIEEQIENTSIYFEESRNTYFFY